MSQSWYYVDDDDVDVGPVSRTQVRMFLRSPRGGRATLVWCKSLDRWKRADEVAELADVFQQEPARTAYGPPAVQIVRSDHASRSRQPPAASEHGGGGTALIVAAWIAAACLAAVAAVIFKANFMWPAALGGIAWLTLSKCRVEPAAVPMLAVMLGHTGWMLVGYMVLAATGRTTDHTIIADVVVVGALSVWFLLARSRAAAIGVLVYQVLSIGAVLAQYASRSLPGVSEHDIAMAYFMHIILRVVGTGLCIYAVVRLGGARSADRQADAPTA